MSLLQPTEAPCLHIELLPSRAKAVMVEYKHLTTKTYDGPSINISTWAPGLDMPCRSGQTLEEFSEMHCDDCEYNTDEMEVNTNGNYDYEIDVDGDTRTITGTFYTHSPCSRYDNGIGDISFPCYAGHEPEEEDDDNYGPLSTKYMRYTHVFRDAPFAIEDSKAKQQNLEYLEHDDDDIPDGFYATPSTSAINCFDNDSICWGDNSLGDSLLQIESIYTTSDANEDLLSFESHVNNANEVAEMYSEIHYPDALGFSDHDHRGKAVVVASARTMTSAFVLLGASGAYLKNGVAYTTAQYYKNVAVDDDHILDVWATDVLPTGVRLLFLENSDEDFNCLFLGQVPFDFNLQPCESLLAPSSELAVPVSN